MQRLKLDETALDLFARQPKRSFLTGLEFLDAATTTRHGKKYGFQPRQVIEICGASDTPKTQVLEHIVASFLTKSSATCYKAPKERVYIFDHEAKVSAIRLASLVADKMASYDRENAVDDALGQVQICCCQDTFQWLATLNHIHFQLLEASPSSLMLVINSVGSFHSIDMMTAKRVGSGLAMSEQVYIFLKQFIRHHSPIVFAAKETTKGTRSSWEHAEYMPSSWTSQVSKRILLRVPSLRIQSLRSCEVEKNIADDEASTQFEARCIAVGESLSFLCQIKQNRIVSYPFVKKTSPHTVQNQNQIED
ncbi:P-loop containing nucleoside triphosphate hydrolase [Plasmopara halstedii]|uniref:p-loop containing nucleoside triphosphate hydrolase n=1 Tax=Plasmopara halstedii TaxID=4781 RepID=A0A0P1AY77_PLAHL|nr:P-loop containing nucleoside triphosphate hydrolase [Plasmopara halstedii]CEG46429.1 P-loop containing nucleoside triphosphate hydrolase [Plasmopara halstedii]|eukprot:XP_024582798.1 P-loop containing nucleoside triphosphate hydrolase [Plasmopara halstedii]